MFLGYPSGYKGYKLLDLDADQVFISRNVQFHEMIFPSSEISSNPYDIFSDRVIPYSSNHSLSSSTRSQHVTRPHTYLKDYHCYLTKHDQSLYPLSAYLDYDHLSPTYKSFVMNVSISTEPNSYHEAAKSPDWCDAMAAELSALEANSTWTTISLPPGKHTVGYRWVYKVKRRANGTLERYKAHLVAK